REKQTLEVDVDRFVEERLRGVGERRRLVDSRVGEQLVDLARLGRRFAVHLPDFVQVRDVGTNADQSELGCRRIQGGRIAAGYDHRGTFLLEALGRRETDPAVAARD